MILRRWASGVVPSRPLAEGTRDRLRTWHGEELEAAETQRRRPRYILQELEAPPLALGWLASHQEDKFPGEPPVPNQYATSINRDADTATQRISSDPTRRPEHTRDATIRWPPRLTTFLALTAAARHTGGARQGIAPMVHATGPHSLGLGFNQT